VLLNPNSAAYNTRLAEVYYTLGKCAFLPVAECATISYIWLTIDILSSVLVFLFQAATTTSCWRASTTRCRCRARRLSTTCAPSTACSTPPAVPHRLRPRPARLISLLMGECRVVVCMCRKRKIALNVVLCRSGWLSLLLPLNTYRCSINCVHSSQQEVPGAGAARERRDAALGQGAARPALQQHHQLLSAACFQRHPVNFVFKSDRVVPHSRYILRQPFLSASIPDLPQTLLSW